MPKGYEGLEALTSAALNPHSSPQRNAHITATVLRVLEAEGNSKGNPKRASPGAVAATLRPEPCEKSKTLSFSRNISAAFPAQHLHMLLVLQLFVAIVPRATPGNPRYPNGSLQVTTAPVRIQSLQRKLNRADWTASLRDPLREAFGLLGIPCLVQLLAQLHSQRRVDLNVFRCHNQPRGNNCRQKLQAPVSPVGFDSTERATRIKNSIQCLISLGRADHSLAKSCISPSAEHISPFPIAEGNLTLMVTACACLRCLREWQ